MLTKNKLASTFLLEPTLTVVDEDRERADTYRLREGRVELQSSGLGEWRQLEYPDIQQHFSFGTAVGKWLAHLSTLAQTARSLLQS